jgi:hypothetical protein
MISKNNFYFIVDTNDDYIMKKLAGILGLLLFIGVQSKAQKEVLFKMQYLPNHNYSSTMKMDMNMQMDITGDTGMVNNIKKSGQKLPMLMQMQSTSKMDVKTGLPTSTNDVPLTMTISQLSAKMTMNGKENSLPMPSTFQKFYAKYTKEGKMEMDSVSGMKMNDSVKNAMMKMVKNIQGNIVFPDKKMKVGDTFIQSIPMEIPIAGSSAKMLGKTTYKLIAVENNKAYFDVNMVMTMDMEGKSMTMDMTGGGDGKMIFDIASGYPTTIQNNINVIYSLAMPQAKNMKMQGKMDMLMSMQTTVAAN